MDKYRTIKPKFRRLGRILLTLDIDKLQRRLFCHVHACQELTALLDEGPETDFDLRFCLAPGDIDVSVLDQLLFSKKSDALSQLSIWPGAQLTYSRRHRSTLNPVINEVRSGQGNMIEFS
mgnify:CR=1 FL=1